MEAAAPPPVADSLVSPVAAAERLAQLALALRSRQLAVDDNARFGGVCIPSSALCGAADAPSVELTCAAVWSWGAATRSSMHLSHERAPQVVQLCEVARDAAWLFLEHAEKECRGAGTPLRPSHSAGLLLACASEFMLGDLDRQLLAQRALADLSDALASKHSAGGEHTDTTPRPWLCVPMLLYAHAAQSDAAAKHGRQCVVECTAFPELPQCWWDGEPPRPLSHWAGTIVAAVIACQGEQETVPWCARVAAASLPQRLGASISPAPPPGEFTEHDWLRSASHLMAIQALQLALPHGWTPLRRVQNAFVKLGGDALRALDEAATDGGHDADHTLTARLAICFALYGFSVEPGGPRVCC